MKGLGKTHGGKNMQRKNNGLGVKEKIVEFWFIILELETVFKFEV